MDSIIQQKKPPYLMLAILFIGAFVSFLNNSLLNVALPSIMVDLKIKHYSTVQWLATGYMLVSGVLIPASAFLITRFSNRNLFITAMAIFTLGTATAAFAPNFSVLLAGRMIQAAGSSVMGPLLMNIMLVSFPREKRGTAMGVFGLVMITAPAIGPTLSGYIVEYYDWRLLFKMILPLAIISLLLAIWKMKNVMDQNKKATVDFFSIILSTLGFGGLLYGFSSASSDGWTDSLVLTTLIVGAIALVAFIIRQLKLKEPLLDLRAYKYPMFTLASIIAIVNAVAMFSGMILTPAYVQSVRGISPLDSGLMMLPGAIIMGIMSPITGKLFDKFGPRILAVVGLIVTAVSTYMLANLQIDSSYSYIILVYTLRMFGMSMVMMPIMTNGLNQLPNRLNPHGTAINNTAQQVSGSIGTAVLVTIMNSVTKTKAEDLMTSVDPTTLTKATEALLTQKALLAGIQYSFYVALAINIVALVLALFVKRVDTSNTAVSKLNSQESTQMKPAEVK
ncbi:MFS transporter [Heyndrickxia sporothermodurans]|uniref:DHA2 family efflux MFS transporter permease subunit n=1 Tax=Heyndrickxia sporothermodurans TaxID=46224 RepID=A0AB37HKG3_9BACI|nr:DHA2 family efflux MFS transporter permease subunit [Heyndrickxia sporothermodurans]MBL5768831.1 DHA2 family efflux MFS transporter permease subunit [Heyndrickxia sporothermodurans]MBL5772587.1 DHA2 family efflux MFS transporter permease subunit [Heyndrickxia sporothermodurans]MBL5779623.1 DHA2 family efflux MFS transporter permease subunit [Heyndrickxia sporothermodurans]MBL5783179.1 DHA2 family efflux MFS transporter permease subunit [Heyndrickxia sporothermodurans]MBL5790296.1 DHA2 famil